MPGQYYNQAKCNLNFCRYFLPFAAGGGGAAAGAAAAAVPGVPAGPAGPAAVAGVARGTASSCLSAKVNTYEAMGIRGEFNNS
jgi:hypothetical protein